MLPDIILQSYFHADMDAENSVTPYMIKIPAEELVTIFPEVTRLYN